MLDVSTYYLPPTKYLYVNGLPAVLITDGLSSFILKLYLLSALSKIVTYLPFSSCSSLNQNVMAQIGVFTFTFYISHTSSYIPTTQTSHKRHNNSEYLHSVFYNSTQLNSEEEETI
jgi:hypothetical protein